MPVHTNSIGDFTFYDLVGNIVMRKEQLEVMERPGVPDFSARKIGIRGPAFQLVSITFHDSFTVAATQLSAYAALIGAAPQTVTRNSVSFGTFLVIDVGEATPPQAVFNVVGAPGKQCRAECVWSLRHVALP